MGIPVYSVDYVEREDELNSSRFKCLCGVHVRDAAKIIAMAIIVLSSLGLLVRLNFGHITAFDIFGTCLTIFVCALIILGDREERAGYYVPYLVVSIIGMLIFALVEAFMFYAIFDPYTFYGIFSGHKLEDQEEEQYVRISSTIILLVVGISVLVKIYLWYIVFKAYKYMTLLEKQKNSNPTSAIYYK